MRILLLAILLIPGFQKICAQDSSETLFNRVNLDGWTIYGNEKWYVVDSLLVYEGAPDKQYGYLGTNNHYKDFVVQIEIAQDPKEKCAISFRSTIEGTQIREWQVLVTLLGKNTISDPESYGSKTSFSNQETHMALLKSGIWNDFKIRVIGNHVTTWLNEQQTDDFVDEKMANANGSLSLQVLNGQNAKIYWRNMTINQMSKSKPNVSFEKSKKK